MLKIAAAQYLLSPHNSLEDFKISVEKWVKEASDNGARLLVFPEYGSIELVSLLSEEVQKNLAQQLSDIQNFRDEFIQLYVELAKKYDVYIVAPSFPWLETPDFFVNRAFLINPNGLYSYQDKQMMTRFEDEQWMVSTPKEKVLNSFDVDGVKVGISICFDVEFPDFARELAAEGVEVLVAPSCTEGLAGMNRIHVGARARALENQFYVVVSQTVGMVHYSEAIDKNTGMAAIYSTCDLGFPDDGIIVQGTLNVPQWVYAEINTKLVEDVRKNGHVFNFQKIKALR
ncbi:carbon-nitrogen hydrolase family protein [Bacteriovorax sp. PP10]|uniref:Carbon-nitrogen hydrolase family protein n=1 Tax=Bacteriovorax antarcticus TaxID=3088717 RepID=A0ABU5VVX6_9BACT|nr:carbon-nitrogen hydrolase family protein [Bacteriovorax sp. PP10]MEA9357121.1 carbon-nitrogen hydrolase family protein [Bacteriovorax sp. PP10]